MELLEIYDPIVLRWLYLRKSPQQSFMLAFDSEIYRQYDEFDRASANYFAGLDDAIERDIMRDAIGPLPDGSIKDPIPFRQAVGYGQIVQWNRQKLGQLLDSSGLSYGAGSIDVRLPRARTWLTLYNPGERVELLAEPNRTYAASLDEEAQRFVRVLRDELSRSDEQTVKELELLVYGIPKKDGLPEAELRSKQRTFFGHVYNLLIGRDTGPRLGTFLWAADRKKVLELLAAG
jgi:lysyl-tRNA synthetase class 1